MSDIVHIKDIKLGDIYKLGKHEIIICNVEGNQAYINVGVMERFIDIKELIKILNDEGWKKGIRINGKVEIIK